MKDIKIIVATHKKYQMPTEEIYIPIHVGAEGKEKLEYVPDNTGENISVKNPYYCELTGLFWAWKNLDAEYIGLVHYRRYFTQKPITLTKSEQEKFKIVLNQKEVEDILNTTDIILPKKRRYFIETLYSHYKHTLHVETLEETRKIVSQMENHVFMLSYSQLLKTALFSQEISVPLIAQITNATLADYKKTIRKLEVLETGDPSKFRLIPASGMTGIISYKLYTEEVASKMFPELC